MARMTARGIKLTRADVTQIKKVQAKMAQETDLQVTWADAARAAMRRGAGELLADGVLK